MSRAPHEHLTDNEFAHLMSEVGETLEGTARAYHAEMRAALHELAQLRVEHKERGKVARVQAELRETLLAQRDDALKQLQECDRVNAASLATIERLERTLACLEASL